MRKRLKQILLLSISVFLLFGAGILFAKQDKVLEIRGLKKVGRELKTEFKSRVSQKNLLGLKRKSKFSLPRIDKYYPQVETLKILGIRVEFQQEVPDDPLTTGNGLFDRRSYQQHYEQESHIIDPPPHYRKYFLAHLKALNNYWYIVSKGKVILDTLGSEVYPLEESLTYQLPHTISYYGSPDSAGYPYEGLGKFFHDSFHLADSLSPEIDFSAYDAFIIFHAGSDKQSDIGSFSPTYSPEDLYTGFIIHETPVSVDNDSFAFNEAIIMPETRSQDTRISALNSVMAHEFGHQLGLLDFYNTKTFTTQIGNFSLMDNNAQDFGIELDSCRTAVTGLIPVYPDAWSMAYLGFNQPEEILNQNNIKLYASEMLRADSIQSVKIPVNSEEYFLIENRQMDIDGESISLLADSETGVVLGPVTPDKKLNREYDVLLPGSGILIWHIDEGVAYLDYDGDGFTNFEDNALQWDKDRRFITLEEADGYIDFGGDYYTGFGLQEDMYYLGNNSNFTPDTYPSSRSNNRSETHIYVTNIGKSGVVMSFNVKNDIILAGWPQRILADSGNSSMVYGDLDGDGKEEVLTASGRFIYAWRLDGSKYIPNSDAVQVEGLDGEYTLYPLAIFAEAETTIFGTPSLGDLNRDDTLEVAVGDLNGKVYIWKAVDNDSDGRADNLNGFPVNIGGQISMTPVISDFKDDSTCLNCLEVLTGTSFGQLALLEFKGLWDVYSYFEKIVGLVTTDV
ncbi:MAG: hypothetical protein OEV55_02350, partial [candidate division Zixibacteria bacterium]|nr:hypothetical protein [candidate division Zixibacteria bacterium]